ncbi:uncharacterized protein LOC135388390 [Ornithodoros turicata]|uniref:uncharacterized protein LOC135388390 n=1 Tax=Ornithodoros turicata TaxID=34597 RepID=UPI0031386B03
MHLQMKVKTLITDRHTEIKAFMMTSHPDVQHRFDVWHVTKGIRKKIIAASHSKQHQVLQKWSPTIINHLYWCARTSDDDGELVLAKWQTILRHVIDIHEHPGSLHERCAHGDIGERLWLHEGTETFKRLEKVIASPYLLKDVPKLSPHKQTFGLEAFHSVIIHFAPKASKFSIDGMCTRTKLAALHFNHNADREIADYILKFSKARKTWAVAGVRTKPTLEYVTKLIDCVLDLCEQWPSYASAAAASAPTSYETLCSRAGPRPPLQEALDAHKERFSH